MAWDLLYRKYSLLVKKNMTYQMEISNDDIGTITDLTICLMAWKISL